MNSRWDLEKIPDLTGKITIVTGGNSGIGFEAAKALGRKGAEIIIASRNPDKAEAALNKIQGEIPQLNGDLIILDLASLKSIREFVKSFKSNYDRLDILLNNAGIMMVPYGMTEDGFELQFGTNHLGHFALTGLLSEYLLRTPGSRVVNISSNAHYSGSLDFDDLMYQNGNVYSPRRAYGTSKLANLLFTYELQRRFEKSPGDAIAVAAHPGISNTSLADHLFERWNVKPLRPLMGLMFQSAAMGSLPSIRAAVDPSVVGGQYYGPDGSGERSGFPVIVESNPASHNLDDAKLLWKISEELTGIHYLP